MTSALWFLGGIVTSFGIIAVINWVMMRTTIRDSLTEGNVRHLEALSHWQKMANNYADVAGSLRDLADAVKKGADA